MELTNEDVADIMALLDSLPYDEFDLRTPRFRLTLRRAPGGGWTEESQVLTDPVALEDADAGGPIGVRADPGAAETHLVRPRPAPQGRYADSGSRLGR